MPEVPVDPMKVVEDAVLEFTDKKDLLVAYMSSMIGGDQGMLVCFLKCFNEYVYQDGYLAHSLSLLVGEPVAEPVIHVVTEKGVTFYQL